MNLDRRLLEIMEQPGLKLEMKISAVRVLAEIAYANGIPSATPHTVELLLR